MLQPTRAQDDRATAAGSQIYVIGYGLAAHGWEKALEWPLGAFDTLAGLTAAVSNHVHDLGYRGATVQIEARQTQRAASILDSGDCPCSDCQGL